MKHTFWNIIGILSVITAFILAKSTTTITKEKTLTPGINIANMDPAFNPGNDFYEYATHGWQVKNPIPDDYARYGSFETLDTVNQERTKKIAETDTGKIGTMYQSAMDAEKLNADKTKPVAEKIATIDKLTRQDLETYLGNIHRFSSAFWGDGVALDEKDSEYYLYNIGQGGIGISRDYFFDTDEKSVEIRKKYKEFITKQEAIISILRLANGII